jgi:8-oxo-dGTP diphosphatase
MSTTLVRAAGGVVYSYTPAGNLTLLLIRDRHKAWTLPKGHLEPGEDDETAALREIAEETGISCVLERPLTRVRYPVYRRGGWCDKEVAYFLASAAHTPPTPAIDEGIVIAAWVDPVTAVRTLTYAQVREVVRQALAILQP